MLQTGTQYPYYGLKVTLKVQLLLNCDLQYYLGSNDKLRKIVLSKTYELDFSQHHR